MAAFAPVVETIAIGPPIGSETDATVATQAASPSVSKPLSAATNGASQIAIGLSGLNNTTRSLTPLAETSADPGGTVDAELAHDEVYAKLALQDAIETEGDHELLLIASTSQASSSEDLDALLALLGGDDLDGDF